MHRRHIEDYLDHLADRIAHFDRLIAICETDVADGIVGAGFSLNSYRYHRSELVREQRRYAASLSDYERMEAHAD